MHKASAPEAEPSNVQPSNVQPGNVQPSNVQPGNVPPSTAPAGREPEESFGTIFSEYEQSHRRGGDAGRGREGTVIAVSADTVFLDIGFKSEGILPLATF